MTKQTRCPTSNQRGARSSRSLNHRGGTERPDILTIAAREGQVKSEDASAGITGAHTNVVFEVARTFAAMLVWYLGLPEGWPPVHARLEATTRTVSIYTRLRSPVLINFDTIRTVGGTTGSGRSWQWSPGGWGAVHRAGSKASRTPCNSRCLVPSEHAIRCSCSPCPKSLPLLAIDTRNRV